MFRQLSTIKSVTCPSPQTLQIKHKYKGPRHRKPWHLISDTERMQFVTGFQTLRTNGILSTFCETHRITDNHFFMDIHHTSAWLFWHSYFVWEIESQIRKISDEYECFSMPYWDITNDAQYITDTYLPILDSVLGPDGDPDNNHCVEDEIWNLDTYTTEFLCASDSEISPNCCLKRERNPNHHCPNHTDILQLIQYNKFKDFQTEFDILHADIHKIVARNNGSHMWSYNAPEDPLFVLFHSFIDYIRAMRQDCFQFDQVGVAELDEYIPFVYDNFVTDREDKDGNVIDAPSMKYTLDTVMNFGFIQEAEWSWVKQEGIELTPRMMFDIAAWNVSFELGSFWRLNEDVQDWCDGKLNETWFYEEMVYDLDGYDRMMMNKMMGIHVHVHEVGVGGMDSKSYILMMSVIGACFVVMVGWFIWVRRKDNDDEYSEMKENIESYDYGSV